MGFAAAGPSRWSHQTMLRHALSLPGLWGWNESRRQSRRQNDEAAEVNKPLGFRQRNAGGVVMIEAVSATAASSLASVPHKRREALAGTGKSAS